MSTRPRRSKVQRNYQITLPAEIRNKAKIKIGELVSFEVVEDGILLKPQERVDRSQSWFWAKKWQEAEKKVEEDVKVEKKTEVKKVADKKVEKKTATKKAAPKKATVKKTTKK